MLSATSFGKLLNILDLFHTRSRHQYDRLQGRLGKAFLPLEFLDQSIVDHWMYEKEFFVISRKKRVLAI